MITNHILEYFPPAKGFFFFFTTYSGLLVIFYFNLSIF